MRAPLFSHFLLFKSGGGGQSLRTAPNFAPPKKNHFIEGISSFQSLQTRYCSFVSYGNSVAAETERIVLCFPLCVGMPPLKVLRLQMLVLEKQMEREKERGFQCNFPRMHRRGEENLSQLLFLDPQSVCRFSEGESDGIWRKKMIFYSKDMGYHYAEVFCLFLQTFCLHSHFDISLEYGLEPTVPVILFGGCLKNPQLFGRFIASWFLSGTKVLLSLVDIGAKTTQRKNNFRNAAVFRPLKYFARFGCLQTLPWIPCQSENLFLLLSWQLPTLPSSLPKFQDFGASHSCFNFPLYPFLSEAAFSFL